jgi:O-antigen/teichoic acid export membrane protein
MVRRRSGNSVISRGLLSIVGGSAVGQGILMLGYPVLTRLYTPAEFGLFAVCGSVVSIIAVVSTATLETAIPIPSHDDEAAAVAWSAMWCVGLTALLTLAIGWPLVDILEPVLGAPGLAGVWWLVALSVLALGLYEVLSTWMIRRQAYSRLGWRNLFQGIGQLGTQTGLGAAGAGSVGLLLGLAVGRFCALGGMISRDGLLRQPIPGLGRLCDAVRRFRQFPLLAAPSVLLNSAGLNLPILVISALYGDVRAGLLALTVRVIGTPSTIIGQAVSQVFMGESSARIREPGQALGSLVRQTTLRLTAVGAIPAVVLICAGPQLFGLVFDARWVEAGQYAQILSVAYLAGFVAAPLASTLFLLEHQGQLLIWSAARLILTTGGPAVCGFLHLPISTAVATLCCGQVLGYSLLYVLCVRAAKLRDRAHRTP